MEIRNFGEIKYGEKYLINKKDFAIKDGFLIYAGGFLTPTSIEDIQYNTNNELTKILQDFTIEAQVEEDGIEISPLTYERLQKSPKKLFKDKNKTAISVNTSPYKLNIFENLYNLNGIFKTTNTHHIYYKEIEEILDTDLSEIIENYKVRYKVDNFILPDGEGVYNPIIGSQIEKVQNYINRMIDNFSAEQKTLLLKTPYWPGWGEIYTNFSNFLYEKYHQKDYEIINRNTTTLEIQNNFLFFDRLLGGAGESIKTTNPMIKQLSEDIFDKINDISKKPNENEMEIIISDIVENIINKFVIYITDNELHQNNQELAETINSKIFNLIQNIKNIIILKNYQNTDFVSVSSLYKQLYNYYQKNDEKNMNFITNLLYTFDNIEFKKLNQEQIKELKKILYKIEGRELLAKISKI